MINRATAVFVTAVLICMIPVMGFAMTPYTQDFEGLSQPDPGAMAGNGWLVFANVFGPGGAPYLYGYGVFGAPNDGGGFGQIVTGEGGPTQQSQQLVVFSDYNNADHGVGNLIEANLFQEQVVAPGDLGMTWTFNFDAKRGNLEGASTAAAFIKTLDPNAGFSLTNFLSVDTTAIPTSWNSYSLSIVIDPSLVGQILQIGFLTNATNYEGSGVFYDNIAFSPDGTVATEQTSFGDVKSRF